jgi:Protein of unknown function (DUF1073)
MPQIAPISLQNDRNDDSLRSLLTNLGSDIDPTANVELTKFCGNTDTRTWYENGGLGETVCGFWASKMAQPLVIEVEPLGGSIAAQKRADDLARWLDGKLQELDVVGVLEEAERMAAIEGGTALLLLGEDGLNGRLDSTVNASHVRSIMVAPRNLITVDQSLIGSSHGFIDHDQIQNYIAGNSWGYSSRGVNRIATTRVIPLVSQKILSCTSGDSYENRLWGVPWIGRAIVDAANKYFIAVTLAQILLHKKSFLDVQIRGLFDKLNSEASSENVKHLQNVLMVISRASNLLGIQMSDLDEMKTGVVERSLQGVSDVIDQAKDNLLAQLPDMPEIYIFGRHRVGGLTSGGAEADEQRVDSSADERWRKRWFKPIYKIVQSLIYTRECPEGYGALNALSSGRIKISRRSQYSPHPLEVVQVAQAELELEIRRWEFEAMKAAVAPN